MFQRGKKNAGSEGACGRRTASSPAFEAISMTSFRFVRATTNSSLYYHILQANLQQFQEVLSTILYQL